MRKIGPVLILLSLTIYFCSLSALAQGYRQSVFNNLYAAIHSAKTDDILNQPRVRMAMEYLLVHGDTRRAKKYMYEAGWPNGFSIVISYSRFNGGSSELKWLRKELNKLGIYLQVVD